MSGSSSWDDFHTLDPARWTPGNHPLGRGAFGRENVAVDAGLLRLSLPAGSHDGGEVQSTQRHRHGSYEARMRVPHAPGSISASFLYQGVSGWNDEIDIEIYNDGSRRMLMTLWKGGRQTQSAVRALPFDPAEDFHRYRIDYDPGRVRFGVDGVMLQEWSTGVPTREMHVLANAWWPTWLAEPPPEEARQLEIDWIRWESR